MVINQCHLVRHTLNTTLRRRQQQQIQPKSKRIHPLPHRTPVQSQVGYQRATKHKLIVGKNDKNIG